MLIWRTDVQLSDICTYEKLLYVFLIGVLSSSVCDLEDFIRKVASRSYGNNLPLEIIHAFLRLGSLLLFDPLGTQFDMMLCFFSFCLFCTTYYYNSIDLQRFGAIWYTSRRLRHEMRIARGRTPADWSTTYVTLSRAANGETKSRSRLETSKSINFHRPNLLREVSCMHAEASQSEFCKPIVTNDSRIP